MTDQSTWLSQGERGTLLGIRFAFRMATLLGRWPMRPFVALIALWYRLFDRKAVRASRDWLTRVRGEAPGFWGVYRHIRTFAQVTLDRIFLVSGKTKAFEFTRTGNENLIRLSESGTGAVLLGAHLGSFEAMRAGGKDEEFAIQILGHFENAKMINALLERLCPDTAARVIHIGDDPVGVMARVRERVEAGDMVGVLGDRVGLNDRKVKARFFGADAWFAGGPFLIASLLRCPVYLVFGLYREPNRYDLHCEPFADRIEIPRGKRDAVLAEYVQRFAARLEEYCRRADENWFNFYDFWRSD